MRWAGGSSSVVGGDSVLGWREVMLGGLATDGGALGGGEIGFLEFEQRGFEVEERCMGAEGDAVDRDLAEDLVEAADAFEHGDFDEDLSRGDEAEEGFGSEGAQGIDELEPQARRVLNEGDERCGVDGFDAKQRVHHAFVLHDECELDEQSALGGGAEELREGRVVEPVAVVIGMESDAGHAMNFGTPPQFLFPIRGQRMDGSEGQQHAAAVVAAGLGEAGIGAREVLVEQSFERSGPSLGDVVVSQLGDQAIRFIGGKTSERPLAEGDVGIDEGS